MKNTSQQVMFFINLRRKHGQASVGLKMLSAISSPSSSQAQPPLPDYQDIMLPPNTSPSRPGEVSCFNQSFRPCTHTPGLHLLSVSWGATWCLCCLERGNPSCCSWMVPQGGPISLTVCLALPWASRNPHAWWLLLEQVYPSTSQRYQEGSDWFVSYFLFHLPSAEDLLGSKVSEPQQWYFTTGSSPGLSCSQENSETALTHGCIFSLQVPSADGDSKRCWSAQLKRGFFFLRR